MTIEQLQQTENRMQPSQCGAFYRTGSSHKPRDNDDNKMLGDIGYANIPDPPAILEGYLPQ